MVENYSCEFIFFNRKQLSRSLQKCETTTTGLRNEVFNLNTTTSLFIDIIFTRMFLPFTWFLTASYVEKASLCVTFSKKKSKLCLGANLIKQILSCEDKIAFKFLLTSVLLLFWSYTILYMFIPIITPHSLIWYLA